MDGIGLFRSALVPGGISGEPLKKIEVSADLQKEVSERLEAEIFKQKVKQALQQVEFARIDAATEDLTKERPTRPQRERAANSN
jgi:hypothetical protein